MSGDHDICEERGRVVWHSSEKGGGPDVGRSIGLGDGWILWIGEITRDAWEKGGEEGNALGGEFGTWIILYGPGKDNTTVIGRATDNYVGEDLLTRISLAINGISTLSPTQCAEGR